MTQLESTLEAVLFAAGDAVSLDRLCAALETPREDILAAAGALEALYDLENRGLMLRRIGDRESVTIDIDTSHFHSGIVIIDYG